MKASVLLFNFTDKSRVQMITRALLPLGIKIKRISKEDYLQPLGFLAGVKEIAPVEEKYNGEELTEEMLLMAGITGKMVDQVLLALRKTGIGRINYKAVLTLTNQYWSAMQLYQELAKEHEMVTQKINNPH
ncbi:MAG TPA: DUF3783 domain-containing protein [Lachnospiraceae bacterium]|jgi:truncated hemoglobin YjbI|nr:DUF3783 domain-containing protein [Lachnospiraceae bacterium]HBY71908.1 DUF3783 domain-containing protein [Lachnospiraceae bacterium]HCA70047.1 DUF3783 domain-containing protein [Lachnospiraceae bacterium]HCM13912.1 DUF3783 domain-containing protein [Lachnospiraceae bacterium]HCR41027.1 DUF3783 domain-containing protein [Lachnospiraceae bacterium]